MLGFLGPYFRKWRLWADDELQLRYEGDNHPAVGTQRGKELPFPRSNFVIVSREDPLHEFGKRLYEGVIRNTLSMQAKLTGDELPPAFGNMFTHCRYQRRFSTAGRPENRDEFLMTVSHSVKGSIE